MIELKISGGHANCISAALQLQSAAFMEAAQSIMDQIQSQEQSSSTQSNADTKSAAVQSDPV